MQIDMRSILKHLTVIDRFPCVQHRDLDRCFSALATVDTGRYVKCSTMTLIPDRGNSWL